MKRILHLLFLFITLFINSGISLADSIESLIMPGPVIEGHAKYEDDCNQCHKIFDKSDQNKLCLSCHKDINKDVKNKQGYHGKYPIIKKTDCNVCHIEHKGRDADIIKLDYKTFQHQYTDFKLKGSH